MNVVACKAANAAAFVANLYLNKRYGQGIRLLSATYDHVAIPKGPAFAIWGVIYLWELVWVLAQACTSVFDEILPSLTPCFCAGTLMQGAWVYLFTRSDPENKGDFWIFLSSALLIATPVPFLGACGSLAAVVDGAGPAYWLSYGITLNAAWVFLAAGLTVNLVAVAAGVRGAALSAIAVLVLAISVALLLVITGLVGSNPFNSPTAFFTTGVWALFWVYQCLKDIPENAENEHGKRILPMYGSTFVTFYKWTAVALLAVFVCLEVLVCQRKPLPQ